MMNSVQQIHRFVPHKERHLLQQDGLVYAQLVPHPVKTISVSTFPQPEVSNNPHTPLALILLLWEISVAAFA